MRALRLLRLGGLGLLVVGSAGCVVHASTSSAPTNVPPPAAFSHPGYVYYAPGQAPPAVAPVARMPPAIGIQDPINVAHLRAVAAQPPRCNLPREVAPGVFVHLDCYPYKRVGVAVKHATPMKLDMARLGRLKWNPFAVNGPRGIGPTAAPVRAGDGQTYPDLVDHRLNGTEGPVKDQGAVGACTAFALSSVIDNSLRRAKLNITTAPQHLWSRYGIPTMEDAASANLNRGITTHETLPYSGKEACKLMRDTTDDCGEAYGVRPNTAQSDPALQAKLRTADGNAVHRAVAFEELEVNPPNIDEIVATLASGADLWAAFNVNSAAWVSSAMQNYVIRDWMFADGGHAVAISGYRKVNGSYQFLVHNSWGTSWGDGGYAWVNQSMVQRWLHLAYKIRTDVDATTPPKTDEDCRGDQVLDTVTSRCTGICPDSSRPANGQCPNGPAPPPQPLPLPNLSGWPGLPGVPSIPGWFPVPQQPQPNVQPGPQPAPTPSNPQAPVWPWPVPTNLPPFLQLPK